MGGGNCGDPGGRLETLKDPTCDREGSGYSRVSRESWGIKRVGQVSHLRILITYNTQPMVKWNNLLRLSLSLWAIWFISISAHLFYLIF